MMEDGEHFYIASPRDTSVTSSTAHTDDQSMKTVLMTDNLPSSDGDAEVSSSCEIQPAHAACSLAAVDVINNLVTNAFILLHFIGQFGAEVMKAYGVIIFSVFICYLCLLALRELSYKVNRNSYALVWCHFHYLESGE